MATCFRNDRVALRAFEPADAPAVAAYLNDPDLAGRRYLPDGFSDLAPLPRARVEAALETWSKEAEAWTLAITVPATGEIVGHVRADWEWDPHSPSVCVVVAPSARRRGIGVAALSLAVEFLFLETPAHVVHAWASSWNEEAIAFATRCGFHVAGRRPRAGVHDGAFYDSVAFDLLRPEWEAAGRRLCGA